jgi:hypothetical protein
MVWNTGRCVDGVFDVDNFEPSRRLLEDDEEYKQDYGNANLFLGAIPGSRKDKSLTKSYR